MEVEKQQPEAAAMSENTTQEVIGGANAVASTQKLCMRLWSKEQYLITNGAQCTTSG